MIKCTVTVTHCHRNPRARGIRGGGRRGERPRPAARPVVADTRRYRRPDPRERDAGGGGFGPGAGTRTGRPPGAACARPGVAALRTVDVPTANRLGRLVPQFAIPAQARTQLCLELHGLGS